MNISPKTVVLLITLFTIQSGLCRNQIPILQKQGNTTQLIVDDKPFSIFGGELENFSAASMENRQPICPKNCQRMNKNILEIIKLNF